MRGASFHCKVVDADGANLIGAVGSFASIENEVWADAVEGSPEQFGDLGAYVASLDGSGTGQAQAPKVLAGGRGTAHNQQKEKRALVKGQEPADDPEVVAQCVSKLLCVSKLSEEQTEKGASKERQNLEEKAAEQVKQKMRQVEVSRLCVTVYVVRATNDLVAYAEEGKRGSQEDEEGGWTAE